MPNFSSESSGLNFPRLNVGDQVSPDPVPLATSGNAGALAEISNAADSFGKSLTDLATRAAQSSARAQATADATGAGATGALTPQSDMTVWGQTYNEIAKQQLGVQRQAALRTSMAQAYVDNQDDPGALNKALTDIQSGFGTTGFADLDASLATDAAAQRGDYMTRAASALRDRAIAQGKANFADTLALGLSTLTQTASGASFDDAGSTRVTGAYANLVQNLSKYGPKEAFDVAGLHFDADPTRLGALDASDIENVAVGANREAKTAWILGAAQRLPDAAAKQQFVTDLRNRYAIGDPIFSGVDGKSAETLFDHLDDEANKTHTAEAAQRELHIHNVNSAIGALRYGADADIPTMLAEAKASDDPETIAAADFWSQVPQATRGVLRTVVARSFGLIPEPGEGIPTQALDPNGVPIGPAFSTAPGANVPPPTLGTRAQRNNNPGNLTNLGGGRLWPGQTGTDGRFAIFGTQAAGAAAADQNLVAKQTQHGLSTLTQIIGDPQHGWAPAADGNNPAAYAAAVGRAAGVDPNAPIDLVHDTALRHRVLTAMFGVESGGSGAAAAAPAPAANPWSPPAGVQPGSPAAYAWANTLPDFTADPVRFAQAKGIANVPPLMPQAGFSDPASAEASQFANVVQQRWGIAKTVSAKYLVPQRLFTDAERDTLKGVLAQDPGNAVALARNLQGALGNDGASQALRELGESGPDVLTQLHLADLVVQGGQNNLVSSALDGMRLRGEGAEIPKWAAPGTMGHVRDFDDVTRQYGAAFQYHPDALQAIRNVAEDARVSDLHKGLSQSPDYYMQHAAGGTDRGQFGAFGGFWDVNGRAALLPSWLRQDSMPQALETLGHGWALTSSGPVHANGQPYRPDELGNMQVVSRPGGAYWLTDPKTNQVLRRRDGSAFELNMDDNTRRALAVSMPNQVLH
jgi:hypothetical protein